MWSIWRIAFFFTTPKSTSTPSAEYRLIVLPVSQRDSNAKGTESGSDSKIVNGCTMLSNWEARIRYMKITESRNAHRNSRNVRSSSRPRPEMRVV